MAWLRLALVAGCLGVTAWAAATAPWQAQLVHTDCSFIIDLGEHPVWRPPAAPGYEAFRRVFERSEGFPPPKGWYDIRVSYSPAGVALTALFSCWPVAFLCGLAYLAVRGPRRDVLLQCALGGSTGLATAVAVCVGLWCVIGGWGPPLLVGFAAVGVVGGVVCGLASLGEHAEPGAAGDPGRGAGPSA